MSLKWTNKGRSYTNEPRKSWSKCCHVCAFKCNYKPKSGGKSRRESVLAFSKLPFDFWNFVCVHRVDEEGEQRFCAGYAAIKGLNKPE